MADVLGVLTGDIVKSTELTPTQLDDVRADLKGAAGEAKAWRRGIVRGGPDFFRGDAWQLVVSHARVRVAQYTPRTSPPPTSATPRSS